MTDPRQDEALIRAFELIEEERLAEARKLIQSVLDDDEQNADAWWIYAHAVEDRAEAVRALNKVVAIEPDYDGAEELLAQYGEVPSVAIADEPISFDDTGDDVDFDFDDEDNFDQVTEQPVIAEHKENAWPRRIVIITVILLLAMVGYLIWNSSRQKSDVDEPIIVMEPTVDSVILLPEDEEVLPEITEVPTVEVIAIDELPEETFDESLTTSEISLILGDYQLANDEFIFVDSSLGRTQTINLCYDPSESLRDTIQNTLLAFSNNVGLIELDTQAIAIRILECEAQDTLSFIGVRVDDVTLYDADELSDSEFMGSWSVLD